MTNTSNLRGHRILVVEDEYFIATDTAHELESLGARVVGPCRTEEAARAELERTWPDAAILDINLGHGPSFEIAEILNGRGIPFVFITGHEKLTVPREFSHVLKLEKPLSLKRIVGAVSDLLERKTEEAAS